MTRRLWGGQGPVLADTSAWIAARGRAGVRERFLAAVERGQVAWCWPIRYELTIDARGEQEIAAVDRTLAGLREVAVDRTVQRGVRPRTVDRRAAAADPPRGVSGPVTCDRDKPAVPASVWPLASRVMSPQTWPTWPGGATVTRMDDAVSISEAKTQLSKLIARAERGEEITIRRGSTAVVKLVAIEAPAHPPRSPIGALRGRITISEDADDLGPEWDSYL